MNVISLTVFILKAENVSYSSCKYNVEYIRLCGIHKAFIRLSYKLPNTTN